MKIKSTLVWLLTVPLIIYVTGCAGGSAQTPQPQQTRAPAPTISSLSPSNAVAGGPQFTLTVNGANFVSDAVVTWNGNNRVTTFVSSTQLTATILAGDIANFGSASVAVLNPGASGALSKAVAYRINVVAATISVLTPSTATAGGPQFTLTVNGSYFVPDEVVTWNSNGRATTFVSSTQLSATILASDIATAGNASVAVVEPGSGVSSNAITFVINPAPPTISSLSPPSATAGGPQFTLTVGGAKFGLGAVVTWNGNNRLTTLVSSTQLAVTILASDIATPGPVNVAALNPASGVSNGFVFGITAAGTPKFASTGNMIRARAAHTATLLPSGKVLVIDGGQLDIDDLLVSTASAELFDPSLGSFASTGFPLVARESHTATLLLTGKVLITGGNEFDGYPTWLLPSVTAELYDPGTGTFARTGSMAVGRSGHTASLLADGRVLVVGGSTNVGSGTATTTVTLASAEIYDPGTGTFATAGNMASPRTGHTATVLPSGKVLITGGQNDQTAQATTELYDPQTNSFTATGSMAAPRTGHSATLLINGKVLVAGGAPIKALYPGSIGITVVPLTTAELYDPLTGQFIAAESMTTGRIGHTATLLPNGTILIAGGFNEYSLTILGYESYNSVEIYDPAAGSFISTTPMSIGRFWHTATLLANGAVLVTGGIGGDLELASAEIFK